MSWWFLIQKRYSELFACNLGNLLFFRKQTELLKSTVQLSKKSFMKYENMRLPKKVKNTRVKRQQFFQSNEILLKPINTQKKKAFQSSQNSFLWKSKIAQSLFLHQHIKKSFCASFQQNPPWQRMENWKRLWSWPTF